MKKNYKHIILLICFSLLWANPTMASSEGSKTTNKEVLVISKDVLNLTEKDSTKTKKPDPDYLVRLQQMAAVRNGGGFHSALKVAPASASVTLVPS